LLGHVTGAPYKPPAAAVAALLRRGEGTLAGAWLRPRPGHPALLVREPTAIAPSVPACHGAVWDGRFRLVGPGDPDCEMGALGPAPGLRHLAPRLPAVVFATLPAIRRHGALVAVPALFYPGAEASTRFASVLAPAAAEGESIVVERDHSLSAPASPSG
jgi:tRNA(Ile)-lysidine synthase